VAAPLPFHGAGAASATAWAIGAPRAGFSLHHGPAGDDPPRPEFCRSAAALLRACPAQLRPRGGRSSRPRTRTSNRGFPLHPATSPPGGIDRGPDGGLLRARPRWSRRRSVCEPTPLPESRTCCRAWQRSVAAVTATLRPSSERFFFEALARPFARALGLEQHFSMPAFRHGLRAAAAALPCRDDLAGGGATNDSLWHCMAVSAATWSASPHFDSFPTLLAKDRSAWLQAPPPRTAHGATCRRQKARSPFNFGRARALRRRSHPRETEHSRARHGCERFFLSALFPRARPIAQDPPRADRPPAAFRACSCTATSSGRRSRSTSSSAAFISLSISFL